MAVARRPKSPRALICSSRTPPTFSSDARPNPATGSAYEGVRCRRAPLTVPVHGRRDRRSWGEGVRAAALRRGDARLKTVVCIGGAALGWVVLFGIALARPRARLKPAARAVVVLAALTLVGLTALAVSRC